MKGVFIMSRRTTKHTLDERILVVQKVLEKKKSISTIAKACEVDNNTVKSWVRKYQKDGTDGLKEAKK